MTWAVRVTKIGAWPSPLRPSETVSLCALRVLCARHQVCCFCILRSLLFKIRIQRSFSPCYPPSLCETSGPRIESSLFSLFPPVQIRISENRPPSLTSFASVQNSDSTEFLSVSSAFSVRGIRLLPFRSKAVESDRGLP